MRTWLLAAAALLLFAAPASAAPELVEIGRFGAPVHVASPPNDPRVFVVEQGGTVKIAGGGTFVDLTGPTLSGGERGLLSIAFPPDYATSGLFYVFMTSEPDGDVEVREYRRSAADPNVADPTPVRTLLDEPHSATNHNGGQLQFGPDGALYASIGDNADGENAQTASPFGKIHRIDPSTGARQVWAAGLRNPWRFTFDRATGDMLIGDVGQGAREEVDWVRGSGANFGWPCREGDIAGPGPACATSALTEPAFVRTSDAGFHAIIGGYVVRDPGLPTLNGRYLYGDAALSSLRSVALPDTGDREEPLPISDLSSFGEDACGRLYAASLAGPVYRIQDGAPTLCTPAAPTGGADVTAPRLSVRILRPALRNRRLRFALRCDEACRVSVASRLRRVKRLKVFRHALAANTRTVMRVKLTRRTMLKLRRTLRRRGFVRLAVTVRATDAAGNRSVVTRRGRLKRR
jgi:glucose/sorbosone dehydrogenase